MATFGFSVGDFVTCLQLIREVVQALNDAKGSASEYQSLFQTLVSLNQSLAASELIYLQWNTQAATPVYKKHATAMINGILFERQKCKQLMENFLKSSQPYTDAFIKERGKAVVRNWRKVTWLFQKEEVNKLERELQRHLQALRIYTDALFQNQAAANAGTMGSQVGSILTDVANLRTDVSIVVKALQSWDSLRTKSLGYPWEASASLSENVLLLDANGRSVLLPMLLLSSPMVLHDLLNIMYRGIPGHRKILRREYNITDEDADGILVEESNWNSVIRPRMQISLNVILQASSSWNMHRCPRCSEAVLGHVLQGKRRRCQKCQLTFRVFDRERVVEESAVTGSSGSADNNSTNVTPTASDTHSTEPELHSQSKEKQHIAEDYFFQRVHYQRDIKKVGLMTHANLVRKGDHRKFEINELPPLHRAAARGNLPDIISLLDAGEDVNTALPYQAVMLDRMSGDFYFEGCTPLHLASFFGKANAINLLLDRGASLVTQDTDKTDALTYAICGEDLGVAISLLARGSNINASNRWEQTALHMASKIGTPWLIRLLLQYGADVAAQNTPGETPLHVAAQFGHVAVLNIFLENNPDITTRDITGYDLLNIACLFNQEAAVKILLDYGADVTTRNSDGDTPLHNASWNGNEAIVMTLIERGADITSRDNAGNIPLHYACRKNHAAVVKILLEKGSDITTENKLESEAIHEACRNGSEGAIKVLLEYGLDMTRYNSTKYSPLPTASYHGFENIVRLLIDSGANIETENQYGYTPLQCAAWRGHAELAKALLDMGAMPTHQDYLGSTPLHDTSIEGNEKIARLLLKSGADHTVRDHEGCDPLLRALWNSTESVAKALLEHGASLTSRDCYENTPLISASCRGLENTVKLLLDAGADVNALEENGRTAIHRASFWGHEPIVELLIAKGADPNIADIERRLPLHDAALYGKSGNEKTVRMLLEHGADPSAKWKEGETALCLATDRGNLGVVKILLETGRADVNAQNHLGRTALHVAAILEFTEISELLLKYGADSSIRDNEGLTPEDLRKINTDI